MCHLDLELVMSVRHPIDRHSDHFALFNLFAAFMTEPSLSVDDNDVLMAEPFRNFLDCVAIGVP